jgi:hypothetical protein
MNRRSVLTGLCGVLGLLASPSISDLVSKNDENPVPSWVYSKAGERAVSISTTTNQGVETVVCSIRSNISKFESTVYCTADQYQRNPDEIWNKVFDSYSKAVNYFEAPAWVYKQAGDRLRVSIERRMDNKLSISVRDRHSISGTTWHVKKDQYLNNRDNYWNWVFDSYHKYHGKLTAEIKA